MIRVPLESLQMPPTNNSVYPLLSQFDNAAVRTTHYE